MPGYRPQDFDIMAKDFGVEVVCGADTTAGILETDETEDLFAGGDGPPTAGGRLILIYKTGSIAPTRGGTLTAADDTYYVSAVRKLDDGALSAAHLASLVGA
jgi:hypothetical protein